MAKNKLDLKDLSKDQKFRLAMEEKKTGERLRLEAIKEQARLTRDAAKDEMTTRRTMDIATMRQESADRRTQEQYTEPRLQAFRAQDEKRKDADFKEEVARVYGSGKEGQEAYERLRDMAQAAPASASRELEKEAELNKMRQNWAKTSDLYQRQLESRLGRPLTSAEVGQLATPSNETILAANRAIRTQEFQNYNIVDSGERLQRADRARQNYEGNLSARMHLLEKNATGGGIVKIGGDKDAAKMTQAGYRQVQSGPERGSFVKYVDAGDGYVVRHMYRPSETKPGTYLLATKTDWGTDAQLKQKQFDTAMWADQQKTKGVANDKIAAGMAERNHQAFVDIAKKLMPRLDPGVFDAVKDVSVKDPGKALTALQGKVDKMDVPYDPKHVALALQDMQQRGMQITPQVVDEMYSGTPEAKEKVATFARQYYAGTAPPMAPESSPHYRPELAERMAGRKQDQSVYAKGDELAQAGEIQKSLNEAFAGAKPPDLAPNLAAAKPDTVQSVSGTLGSPGPTARGILGQPGPTATGVLGESGPTATGTLGSPGPTASGVLGEPGPTATGVLGDLAPNKMSSPGSAVSGTLGPKLEAPEAKEPQAGSFNNLRDLAADLGKNLTSYAAGAKFVESHRNEPI